MVRSSSANRKIMTGPAQIIFGAERRRQHLTRGLEVGGRVGGVGVGVGGAGAGVRAHLSAEPNNTMATA